MIQYFWKNFVARVQFLLYNPVERRFKDDAMREFRNILIVRLSAAGDVVHAMPSAGALKNAFPSARLTWVAEPLSVPIVRGYPGVDEVITLDRKALNRGARNPLTAIPTAGKLAGFFRELRSRGFDLAVDFQGNMRSAAVTAGSGAKARVGFSPGHAREYVPGAYTKQVAVRRGLHKVEKDFELVRALGVPGEPERVDIGFTEQEKGMADEFFAQIGGDAVIMHPGVSTFGSFKAWPVEHYARLAEAVAGELGMSVVLTWGPGEEETVEAVVRETGVEVAVSPKTGTMRELACVLSRARAFVGADTGPLHLANMVGAPVVGIYGPKDPGIYGPYFEPRRIVRSETCACSPCDKRRCDDPVCLSELSPERVFEALAELLG